jgi:hypothetical protein
MIAGRSPEIGSERGSESMSVIGQRRGIGQETSGQEIERRSQGIEMRGHGTETKDQEIGTRDHENGMTGQESESMIVMIASVIIAV